MKKKTYVSLACGWGAGCDGFRRTGLWECLAGYDIDAHSIACFKLNFPDVPIFDEDLLKITGEEMKRQVGKRPNLVFITAPCQGASKAGKFDPFHPMNRIMIRCIKLAAYLKPDAILFENVDGLMLGDMKVLGEMVRAEMRDASDYTWVEASGPEDDGVIDCLIYRAPQNRLRYFALGMLKSLAKSLNIAPSFPPPDFEAKKRLHIKDIDPSILSVSTGYTQQSMRSRNGYMFTVCKTPSIFRDDGQLLSEQQVLGFCGFLRTWKTVGSHTDVWNRAGNSVMPPTAAMFADHIYKLLTKSKNK